MIIAILSLFSSGCRRSGDVPRTEAASPRSATTTDGCLTSTAPLPVTPLVIEWADEDRPRRLALDADGSVRDRDAVIARVSGRCIVNPRDAAIFRVDADRVIGSHQERVAVFQQRHALRVDDASVVVDEVLVSPDGSATAVDADGSIYLAPDDRPPFSLPGAIKGDVTRARRTALLLWHLGHLADAVVR